MNYNSDYWSLFHLFLSEGLLIFVEIIFFLPSYLGQPKRHLLTTGWSMFIGAKRLRAGDAVLFIRYRIILKGDMKFFENDTQYVI